MKKPDHLSLRLAVALAAYLILALIATFTLEGVLRTALWLFFLGLAIRTITVAHSKDGEDGN